MGHSHGNHDDLDAVEVGTQARNALIAFLAVVGALAVAGLIWLWPSAAEMEATTFVMAEAPGVTRVDATIVSLDGPCGSRPRRWAARRPPSSWTPVSASQST